jgi:FMN phosphatase YigB (HAD superfamily)
MKTPSTAAWPRPQAACTQVDDIRRVHHAWLGPEYDNVGPIIQRLVEGRRIQTGVLSNTNSAHWSRIERRPGHEPQYPTASLLANQHASYKLGMAKPMPGFYEAFEKNTGYRGSDILFLEDLPDNAAVATAPRVEGRTHRLHTRDRSAARRSPDPLRVHLISVNPP